GHSARQRPPARTLHAARRPPPHSSARKRTRRRPGAGRMRSIVPVRVCIATFALLALGAYLAAAAPRFGHTTFDDAYIFLRYAKHALGGAGSCWNVGEGPSYGVTSVLHLLLVTALRGLTRLSDGAILTLISSAAGLLACAALTALAFLATADAGWRR